MPLETKKKKKKKKKNNKKQQQQKKNKKTNKQNNKQTKNKHTHTQNHENWRLGLTESLHMQLCRLRGCILRSAAPLRHPLAPAQLIVDLQIYWTPFSWNWS